MVKNKTAIDDTITARCTKCRKNTRHTVISIQLDEPEQVECSQCRRQHKYRPPTATKVSSELITHRQKEAECKEWKKLRPGMDNSRAKVYTMSGTYKVNSLIDHTLFGLGLVQRSIGSNKMEVLFEAGKKIMCCKAS